MTISSHTWSSKSIVLLKLKIFHFSFIHCLHVTAAFLQDYWFVWWTKINDVVNGFKLSSLILDFLQFRFINMSKLVVFPLVANLGSARIKLFEQLEHKNIHHLKISVLDKIWLALAIFQQHSVVDGRWQGVSLMKIWRCIIWVQVIGPFLKPSNCYHYVAVGFVKVVLLDELFLFDLSLIDKDNFVLALDAYLVQELSTLERIN